MDGNVETALAEYCKRSQDAQGEWHCGMSVFIF